MVYFSLQMPQFLLELCVCVCVCTHIPHILDTALNKKKGQHVLPLAIVEQIQQVDFVFQRSHTRTLPWLCLGGWTGVQSLLHGPITEKHCENAHQEGDAGSISKA